MNLSIKMTQSELDRLPGLELQLLELSIRTIEVGKLKIFTPQSGKLVQFINLLGKLGAVYEVAAK